YLLEQGAEVNHIDELGWTPLHWAAFAGKLDTCRILIKAGADYKIENKAQQTPFDFEQALQLRGPQYIENDPNGITSKQALEQHYCAIEQCKADIGDYFALMILKKQLGKIKNPVSGEERPLLTQQDIFEIHASSFAQIFKTIRFGTESAHAQCCPIQLNWMLKHGAVVQPIQTEGKTQLGYKLVFDQYEEALRQLVQELLIIKIKGDSQRAKQLQDEYGSTLPDYSQGLMSFLNHVPTDLDVKFI
ncbi:MAG: hypothetical protein EZS28_037507, partial [Streblomastix strix]